MIVSYIHTPGLHLARPLSTLAAESRRSGPVDDLRHRAALGVFRIPVECPGQGLPRNYTDGGGPQVGERT